MGTTATGRRRPTAARPALGPQQPLQTTSPGAQTKPSPSTTPSYVSLDVGGFSVRSYSVMYSIPQNYTKNTKQRCMHIPTIPGPWPRRCACCSQKGNSVGQPSPHHTPCRPATDVPHCFATLATRQTPQIYLKNWVHNNFSRFMFFKRPLLTSHRDLFVQRTGIQQPLFTFKTGRVA